MRDRQRTNYAEKIERAIRLIEDQANGGQPLSLATLAAQAAMSDFHFHRVFRLMTGENVGDVLARVRLGHGLSGLESGGIGLATERSGYATSQSFARALKAATNASPGALRDDPERRKEVSEMLAHPIKGNPAAPPPLTIEVTSFEPVRLLTLRNVGDYAELNGGFGRLFELLMEQVAPETIEGIYGIPEDDPRATDPDQCRFVCGFATGSAGTAGGELNEMTLAGGRYASMMRVGDFDLVHSEIDVLYQWVIENGETIADRPLFIHYLDDPDETPPERQRATIYLPLQEQE